MERVRVRLPNGGVIPIRHTRIFHNEDGLWKMVHPHVSVAVLDESMDLHYH